LRIFKKTAPLLASKAEREVANREMQEEQTGRREKERAEDGIGTEIGTGSSALG
jgi:hypothetical protein